MYLIENADMLRVALPSHFELISNGVESFDFDLALAALRASGIELSSVTEPTWAQLSPKKSASILIVDDSPLNLVLMSNVLMKDYQVRVANCGEKVLRIALSEPPPDLIVLDIMMPSMGGYQVFRQLNNNARTQDIPVIFYTGKSDPDFEKKALELGAADFISKPINVDIARHRIRNLLERESLRKEADVFRDHLAHLVTERTSQLSERMEQLTAILELSPDGFVTFDGDRNVMYASPAFFRMTGFTNADIAGLNEIDFSALMIRGCTLEAQFSGCAALRLAQPEGPINPRQRIEWAGADRRVMEVGLRVRESDPRTQILHLRDVTHETEVEQLKYEFLNTAAHELRTPVASIYGFTELLMTRDLDEARRKDAYAIIFKQATQVIAITNMLVSLSQIETYRGKSFCAEEVSLSDILDATLTECAHPKQRDHAITTAPERPCWVRVDPQQIQRAMALLVSNAYKYSPVGSDVTICFRFTLHQGTSMVGIEVRDKGIGMTQQQTECCFDRFYRADASGKLAGAGLGLGLAREIVDLHHGRIEIQSELGVGTAATLWLPELLK